MKTLVPPISPQHACPPILNSLGGFWSGLLKATTNDLDLVLNLSDARTVGGGAGFVCVCVEGAHPTLGL